jgi:hypothetical protein
VLDCGQYEVNENQLAGRQMKDTKTRWPAVIVILAFVILAFVIIAVVVNPFPELLTQDDGWAYARSVEHLLDTGEYHQDSWD